MHVLKALVIRSRLDAAKHELEKHLGTDDFEAREAELEKTIAELTVDSTDEERAAVSAAVEKLDEERSAFKARKEELEKIVADTEAELREAEEEAPPEKEEEPEKVEEEREKKMDIMELRSSKEYIDAFARYIKTEKDDEIRSLLSTNATEATGYVPVPTIVEERINTAWSKLGLMDLVRKTYIRGNLKVGFELSASPAAIHEEGDTNPPTEEVLTLGVVEMIPKSIKKWITISDEALDLAGEEFLFYVYDELTYQIAKKAQQELIVSLMNAPTTASATEVSVAEITGAPSLSIVAELVAQLSDEADNPVIVMNKATMAAFEAARVAGGFAVDPYFGLQVFYDNTLPAYAAAESTDVWMLVGDFGRGAHANFPNGQDIKITRDDLSLSERDLVKLVGREFVALGLVADKCFARAIKGGE